MNRLRHAGVSTRNDAEPNRENGSVSESEAALARTVLIHGPLSRSALTTYLGLSPASLTRLAKPLIDRGLIVELDEQADGSVGRPSRPLAIDRGIGSFIGIKLTGDTLYAVATDVHATPFATRELPIERTDPAHVIDLIVDTVAALRAPDLLGVGVSLGGLARDGDVVAAAFLDWHNVPLARPLTERLGVPVTIENDVVALAEAERWFGLGRDTRDFVLLTVGAGVGYSLVAEGNTVRTPDASVGTIGHVALDPFGPLCECGHRGCAQAMVSTSSIAAQVSQALRRPVTYQEALRLAADDVPAARAVVDAAGKALGQLLALAANFSLQSTVILAGEGVGLYDLVSHHVDEAARQDRATEAVPLAIHVDRTGFRAWARGAAAVAIQAAVDRLADRP